MTQSIESLKEQIYDEKTKEYFNEVYRSFVNGNNRSAVVFLYSVVLYDLYAKVEELNTVYEDQTAKNILDEINKLQTNKPMSSEWESVLIDRIEKTTNLLEKSEKLDLDHLKQKRNLSAHPTIHSMDLFNPDSHTVQALMFNMLQSILIKPPFFTKNVVGKLVNDLKDRGDSGVSISDQELESLIKNRYLKHMSKKKQEQVFMAFWKFVFITKNVDTNKNRDVNSRALNVLYKECSIDIKETIRKNKNKFEVNKELIPYLIFFISKHEELFERLDETTQADIHSYVKEEKSLRIVSPFLSDSFINHLDELRAYFKSDITMLDSTLIKSIKYLETLAKKSNSLSINVNDKMYTFDCLRMYNLVEHLMYLNMNIRLNSSTILLYNDHSPANQAVHRL